ncbi:MAG: dihydroxyacetone kinase subunit L [Phycisphaerae bacterium]|nr:dihydroxyacetone kinase subunit L [Phycisphaerae bacterium]
MANTINIGKFTEMLLAAAGQIKANEAMLGELDSFGGDGDHGTTMARAMNNLIGAIEKDTSGQFQSLLMDIAWAVMGTDGGATGPLFGSLFMGMSEASPATDEIAAKQTGEIFRGGLVSIQKQTKATIGDKTIMDALIPAVEAIEAASGSDDIKTIFEAGYKAALAGAESTKDISARFGRAKNAGDANLGHQDPGATSVSLIFKGMLEALKS